MLGNNVNWHSIGKTTRVMFCYPYWRGSNKQQSAWSFWAISLINSPLFCLVSYNDPCTNGMPTATCNLLHFFPLFSVQKSALGSLSEWCPSISWLNSLVSKYENTKKNDKMKWPNHFTLWWAWVFCCPRPWNHILFGWVFWKVIIRLLQLWGATCWPDRQESTRKKNTANSAVFFFGGSRFLLVQRWSQRMMAFHYPRWRVVF